MSTAKSSTRGSRKSTAKPPVPRAKTLTGFADLPAAVESPRFGRLAVEPAKVITLQHGMIGFPQQRHFILLDHAPGSPLHWLQSVDEGGLAFPVASPLHFVSDYRPALPSDLAELVGDFGDEDLWLGVVVSFPPGQGTATLNLKAPVVLNTRSRLGAQLVLDDPSLPLRFVLPAGA